MKDAGLVLLAVFAVLLLICVAFYDIREERKYEKLDSRMKYECYKSSLGEFGFNRLYKMCMDAALEEQKK